MRFIGVDLAWTSRRGTGLCVIERNRVQASGRVGGDEELLRWLKPLVQDDVVVAIDAPLIVRNLEGQRDAERLISRCFAAHQAGAYPANLSLPAFREGVRGEWLAAALDLGVDPTFPPRVPVRRAVEVYPHTAIVALFGLATTLKYKGRPGRTLESRAGALGELLDHLESLDTADPPLEVRAGSRWPELRATVADPRTGADLARAEDEIDAYVCAYTALYYWTHGATRCRVAGDATDGYILTPVTAELAACLDRQPTSPVNRRKVEPRRASRRTGSTAIEQNAARVQLLLPGGVVTGTTHVVEIALSGENGLIALVTAETIELRLPTVEWTAGTHGPAEASRVWKRLDIADLTDEALASEIALGRAVRKSEFSTCRYCGESVPVEHRTDPDVCHSCASRHEGVVF
jgi:predicted RNase H-like nuclease